MAFFSAEPGETRRPARPHGVFGVGWACLESAVTGRSEHRPTSADYPETVIQRIRLSAGGGLDWNLSALVTPRQRPAPVRIVVVTGAPSWAEYWAPVMAALPAEREMIVVDRPGYGQSEPAGCVPEIETQARALLPLLEPTRGQRIVLVGQSYGAAIAVLMAQAQPRRVASLVLLSSYLGVSGPTARWLVDAGRRLHGVIPRDLRTAVEEVRGQPGQLGPMRAALTSLKVPTHLIHGDVDDFAPIDVARALAAEIRQARPVRFETVAGAGHFLTDGPPEPVVALIERCTPRTAAKPTDAVAAFVARLGGRLRPPPSPLPAL